VQRLLKKNPKAESVGSVVKKQVFEKNILPGKGEICI
jgi:hypothetical protein